MTKKCASCKQQKPITEFHHNRSTKDGFHPECRSCRNTRGVNLYKRDPSSQKVAAYQKADTKRGFICEITRDNFKELIADKTCFFCGTPNELGLDRIDNNKGHTIDNCVVACGGCNIIRGRFPEASIHDFKRIMGESIKNLMIYLGRY